MKVLHAIAESWLERTQTWLYRQVLSLPPAVESHIACDRVENLAEFPFPRIHARIEADAHARARHWLAVRAGWRGADAFQAQVTRRLRPDVVHSHFGPSAWLVRCAARAVHARHLVTFYGLDVNSLPRQGWSTRYREMFPDIDAVLCEGPFMRRCVIALGCPAGKVHVHRLGVDLDSIRFEPRRWRPGESLRVLLAASFREKKGLPYAIQALGALQRDVDLEVTLIGGPGNNDEGLREAARIQAAIDDAGMQDRVRRLGFVPHTVLHAEAARSHLFLSPSVTASNGDTEGGAPVSLIEMAAAGVPIVSSRHCDIPDIVEDGVTGFLADERDVDGLVFCLRRWLDEPERWPELLDAGRRRVEAHHDARRQAEALFRLYQADPAPAVPAAAASTA